ncbi:MAG: 50S ribosomal protein L28 [Holosporaceae bacterium]|nr:50S ribosomal protein L28 [Holosporaceae bacterium]
MARSCLISSGSVLYGNKVSHANNKTRRRFLPNRQNISFWSDILGVRIRVRIPAKDLRSVEKNGGIDAYLAAASPHCLSPRFSRMKKAIASRG